MDEAILNLKISIEESNAKIMYDPMATIMTDPSQMVLLFQNLIGNAHKIQGPIPT